MFLESTLHNFADDLAPEERLRYLAVISTLPVEEIHLEAQDKFRTVMNGQDTLDVVHEDVLQAALDKENMGSYVANIRNREYMITPLGERDAFGNYRNRIS